MMRIGMSVLAILAAACVAAGIEIPITVCEPAGIARTAEPVSGGIPLPAGEFKPGDGAKFGLFDGQTPVPVQVTELVVDPRGQLRWLLLDFQLDLKARETRTLTLRSGAKPAAPAVKLDVLCNSDGALVKTGKMGFMICKDKPFGLFCGAEAKGGASLGEGEVAYTDALVGKRFVAGPPDSIRLIYNGPLRATLEVRGGFVGDEAKLRYVTYVTAWAGRSDVQVVHSLINSRSDRMYFVKLGGATIALKPQERSAEAMTGKGWVAAGGLFVADRLINDPPRMLSAAEDGSIVLNSAPTRGELKAAGVSFKSHVVVGDNRWIFDCTHHRSEYRIDLAASGDKTALDAKATAAAARVWGFAPGEWYSQCQVLGVGRFGTLADEKACHAAWGWTGGREPDARVDPFAFVAWEDNHYESESDSPEGLLLMFLRTGKRGFFDQGEAWARYHTDLQAWRTEGWAWKDGGIWWPPSNAFAGAKKVRKGPNRPYVRNPGRNNPPDDHSLWNLAWAKGCYCHHYGAGLVDWFCLTGDRDALDAAIDDCEMKLNENTWHRNLVPGKSGLPDTRGFGRGMYVAVRTWMVEPKNEAVSQLVALCRDTFKKLPDKYVDARGVYAVEADGPPGDNYLSPGVKKYMAEHQITAGKDGTFHDGSGHSWKWRDIGGTWMIAYIQDAVDLLTEQTGDEDLMDYSIATGQFAAKFLLSPVAKQTWYYTALDIPVHGEIWDNWKYDGLPRNPDGEGQVHSGWYTRFFPDACARAYSWTGEPLLMEQGRLLWSYGVRRGYQTKALTPTWGFATHVPPKDDSTLSTARLFYWGAHPRKDAQPPAAVTNLRVALKGTTAEVSFVEPPDAGGGRVARCQVKCSDKPIVGYDAYLAKFDAFAGDTVTNWWRAANVQGEPSPLDAAKPGGPRRFVVTGVPEGAKYFAVRLFDDSGNRSAISNVAEAR